MSDELKKNPDDVPGKYYVTWDCTLCYSCIELAPNNFREGDHLSYVYKQPDTPEEEKQCREALECCPTAAILDDGPINKS